MKKLINGHRWATAVNIKDVLPSRRNTNETENSLIEGKILLVERIQARPTTNSSAIFFLLLNQKKTRMLQLKMLNLCKRKPEVAASTLVELTFELDAPIQYSDNVVERLL